MDEVNVFLLFPESHPANQWMRSNADHQSENDLNQYVYDLSLLLEVTNVEVFSGFFDMINVDNFLADFNILEDYYPQPARRLLYSILSPFYDWRSSIVQNHATAYQIFNQNVADHSFCEVGQRKRYHIGNKYLLINHQAHTLGAVFNIEFDTEQTAIESVQTVDELEEWFINNRIPERGFHAIVKHGENRPDVRIIQNKVISPLKSSAAEAKVLLQEAFGENIDELFGYDPVRDNFIVYKFEGNNPQHLYHGYHVPRDTTEVPEIIKNKLLLRHQKKQTAKAN